MATAVACPKCGAGKDQLITIRSGTRKGGRRRRVFMCKVCSPPFSDVPDSKRPNACATRVARYYKSMVEKPCH